MTTERVSPPGVLAVSMDAVREALRLDDGALDVSVLIATKALIAEAEHKTGREFVNRPMRVTLDQFPDAIRLSAPTYSVESVEFLDAAGALQTLDPADYYVDKITLPGYIVPAAGKSWPVTFAQANTVTVHYTAGHGPDESTVPEEAQNFVLARLQLQFDPFAKVDKETLDGLLDSIKVYS